MYNIVAENPDSTVVADYQPLERNETAYQSEADLEKSLIEQLSRQAYEYLPITSEKQLTDNLRKQLGRLNDYEFTDDEWNDFFKSTIANQNYGIEDKTSIIQESHIQPFKKKDGTTKNIYLLDKENIHNNHLQVINQYETATEKRSTRFDVTILVNGLPLVQIELKRRGVELKEAFNQINRYQRDSFWADSGLYEYVQLFVISNGTHTKYYSNTTRNKHIIEAEKNKPSKEKRSSNSYEFTSWWADANNKPITDLIDFTHTFFAKHSILNILTKYCVFTQDKMLLAMRPYQIVATEQILGRIKVANYNKKYGTTEAGGYIWHTTGSGKTLTSFKTAQIASKLSYIDKVLFVVDRKDLDYQTMKEYDKFEKGAANSNSSTTKLKKQLEDPQAKIIITTIQKLAKLVENYKNHDIYEKPIVLIFDECHRSQFGDMNNAIRKTFKKYYLFGFTGTPIFAVNSSSRRLVDLRTTEQAFGKKLHTYTIVDAINDKNVLPFRVDYVSTMKEKEDIQDSQVYDINREKALLSKKRIEKIVSYILEHFDQKTKRNSTYKLKDKRVAGFNSIFAVSKIEAAKLYYLEFKKQLAPLPSDKQLKVAVIFSYTPNEEVDGILDEEFVENTKELDKSSRDFLESAIEDYNKLYDTNFSTSSDKFQNYYKDVSQKVKDRELDLLIVVNMFLTGFDATTLNTLWVDKNLRLHGLLQAYSRTNRILNSIKTYGNIVCFRNLEDATNKSIALFGDKQACGIVLLKPFDDYYNGYIETNSENGDQNKVPGYKELVEDLIEKFPVAKEINGEYLQKEFIKLYGSILKYRNILSSFDEFAGREILSERDVQDYHSMYIDLYQEFSKKSQGDSENINDDIVFEMELIKQVEINIDYILDLIRKYHDGNSLDAEIIVTIGKAVNSSVELRSKKDLIENFITSLTPDADIDEEWHTYVSKKKDEEFKKIIEDENLNSEEAIKFIEDAFKSGYIQETGTAITHVLPAISRFTPNGERTKKKETVIERFHEFFNRFYTITSPNSE
mgnify:CR=1 FL=1